ncbi:glycosyl hydrolase family 28-related protein [Paenibacillus eucommiae]|uniref:Rhamnogalacturonase A/B/Epimerase-like pectate lyase domain-containing protein n=1 Tax=Paenibacillus eucommiae TaxID=1355755 RepID=A0ABS4J3T4_9BACL|nr:glycosyl hydrolase family 28-related protein [Paenibacillus eucommiae]MBP1994502.1 hypothetical protein [Paenibacillus eucommiae]
MKISNDGSRADVKVAESADIDALNLTYQDTSDRPANPSVMSRRKLLSALGIAGATAAVAGMGLNGFAGTASAAPSNVLKVVTSISALRALTKVNNTYAYVTGYYSSGDGGGGNYNYDSTDTTSSDNGGTVIVAADGGRWKLSATGMVSLRQFGAKGDGVADDTAATQAAMTWCETNNRALYVPSGTYKITSPVTTAYTITVIGEAISPSETPDYRLGVPAVTFLSTVAGDYCFKFGNTPGGYRRGGQLCNFRVFGAGINGSGIYLLNQGWDGLIDSITVEGFGQYGVTCDYIQDMHIRALGIIECGKENVYPSLYLLNNCNSVHFDRLHIEITPYMLHISGSHDITFNGGHFEVSEYPSDNITLLNRYSRYSQIIINNGSTHIDFNACMFAPNSVQGVASHFGIAETSVEPFMTATGVKINLRQCSFRQTQNGKSSNMLSFTYSSSCLVDGCFFEQVYMDQYSILLSGTTFVNNEVMWIDNGTSTNFYGIANSSNGSPSRVRDNRFFAFNSTFADKTDGFLVFSASAIAPITLGDNEYFVPKFYKHHNAACKADAFIARDRIMLTGLPATLDLERYDINTLFGYTGTTTTSSIINPAAGQQVSFINYAAESSTIVNGGIVALKGSADATLITNGLLVLQETLNGILVEKSRNF